jgi:Lrp/AsnC family leucine-responsive transcriptional regulator
MDDESGQRRDKPTLDGFDYKILKELSRNARLTNSDLSHLISLSQTATAARRQRLERSGIILNYTAEISYSHLGLPQKVLIMIKLSERSTATEQSLLDELANLPGLTEILFFEGRMDAMLIIVTGDVALAVQGIRHKLSSLACVQSVEASIITHHSKASLPF